LLNKGFKIKLSEETIKYLKGSKNLLAFSGGVDSSALFHILLENSIEFDLAIVDYNFRKQSKDEVAYAKHLAQHFEKKLYIGEVSMDRFSEKGARDIRYNFLEDVIKENLYKNLITGHQLNDKLEWFFMQFSKGAGLLELTGMSEFEVRDGYRLIRPLIDTSKDGLLQYLTEKDIKYFIDASNFDERYKRNYFRHNFSNHFLKEFKSGVANSFRYLEEDKALILKGGINIESEKMFFTFQSLSNTRVDIFYIDKILKRVGYIISSKQRDEILKNREVVIGGEWVIAITENRVYVTPYRYSTMDKNFKERCRVQKVPKLIRPYLFEINSRFCLN